MSIVAFVLADDFEDVEFTTPRGAVADAGHDTHVIGAVSTAVTGKHGTVVAIDHAVGDVDPDDYDALVIAGGFSPDHLRTNDGIVAFVQAIVGSGAPIAAICHAPSLLIEADAVRGVTMTAFPSIWTDLRNAGADVVDQDVVVDGQFITSRDPDDLEAFTTALLAALSESGVDAAAS